jgi:hypothetical protein
MSFLIITVRTVSSNATFCRQKCREPAISGFRRDFVGLRAIGRNVWQFRAMASEMSYGADKTFSIDGRVDTPVMVVNVRKAILD